MKPTRLPLDLCLMLLAILLLLSAPACSHVPLMAEDNDNISLAMHISDADKSWAVYGLLPQQAAHYYSLDRKEGERERRASGFTYRFSRPPIPGRANSSRLFCSSVQD
ncbi:MAG: hypothetical protein LUO83_00370 [Methanothrix sp.]|nr:hypothetical protein [Methanothrix sp.]